MEPIIDTHYLEGAHVMLNFKMGNPEQFRMSAKGPFK